MTMPSLNERPLTAIVVMGVTGSGKTTIGRLLAQELGWRFYDADDFHPPHNRAKMQSGYALDDADRASWLESLHDLLAQSKARDERVVLACSALKARYREQLGVPDDTSALIYLTASEALVRERLLQRAGHFMPAALIPSQFLDLEEPPHAIRVDASLPPAVVVTQIREALGLT